jgi:hypothetical protein
MFIEAMQAAESKQLLERVLKMRIRLITLAFELNDGPLYEAAVSGALTRIRGRLTEMIDTLKVRERELYHQMHNVVQPGEIPIAENSLESREAARNMRDACKVTMGTLYELHIESLRIAKRPLWHTPVVGLLERPTTELMDLLVISTEAYKPCGQMVEK